MFGSRREKLMLAALAAGVLSASAWSQTPEQGHRGAGPQGMGPMRGMERLHKDLKLDPQQEDLWKKAQAASRDAFQKMRAGVRDSRAKLRAEIDKPGADLKQIAQLRDQMREQMRPQMESVRAQIRQAWFALYDALNPGQREQVRLAIKSRMDRMDRMHERMRERDPRGEFRGEFGLG